MPSPGDPGEGMDSTLLAVVLVLILVVLRLILLLVLLILLLILAIHIFSSIANLRKFRSYSVPRFSGFIPCLEKNSGKESCKDRSGDSSGGSLQPAGKDSQKAVLIHRFPDALGKRIAEARQGNGGTCTGKFCQWLVDPDCTQNYACYHVGNQNSCRSQLGFVNQNLPQQA